MNLPPSLYFHLLADRELKPGAVTLQLGQGDGDALLPQLVNGPFSAFVAAFPCFLSIELTDQLAPELLLTLENAGCRRMPSEAISHSEAQQKPILPPLAHWLSGNWYMALPAKITGAQAASRSLSLKLLQLVATDADTSAIEAIFRQDPVLAYHLLRLVNSTGIGVGRHISSFSQAILILGRQQLKRWLNLMLFAASHDDYRSPMLLAHVTVRARSMELLAKASGLDRSAQEQAFMAGMFSLLGILFGIPLADVLNPLKLNESLSSAILNHAGVLGGLLQTVESAERADDAGLNFALNTLNLTTADFNALSLEAYQWMLGVIHDKQDSV